MLPSSRCLKKDDFISLKKLGAKIFHSGWLTLRVYQVSLVDSRFAVVVSSAISKKAVERNKLKRKIKDIIYRELTLFKKNFAIIIYVKKGCLGASYQDLKKEVVLLFKKANILNKQQQ